MNRRSLFVIGAIAVVVITVSIITMSSWPNAPRQPARLAAPSPYSSATSAAFPPTPRTALGEVNAAPLAYYDAVIPHLLNASQAHPRVTWEIATPIGSAVPLYSQIATTAVPVAKLAAAALTTPTAFAVAKDYPTVVSVFGTFGGWILIGTPARIMVPHSPTTAPAISYAYARAADFRLQQVAKMVVVDTSTSTISIVTAAGKILATDNATIGAADTPTPHGFGYIEASYIDPKQGTGTTPINLTNAHSSTLATYGADQALTAIHWEAHLAGAHSHGCIRVSISMADQVSHLLGYPVEFE
jgi:hypothetical protein